MIWGCWRWWWPMMAGGLTTECPPALLLANPADAFRLFNLSASQAAAAASGLGAAAKTVSSMAALGSILISFALAFGLALAAFRRLQP